MKISFNGREPYDLHDNVALIKDQLKHLENYASDGRKPSEHLLKDIALYRFILNSFSPMQMAEKYLDTKHKMMEGAPFNKNIRNYEVGDFLKWDYFK